MDRNTDLAAQIQRLSDIEAIKAMKHRYAALVDQAIRTKSEDDILAVVAVFSDDATADYGPLGACPNRAAIGELLKATAAQNAWTIHIMSNPIIMVDGARATGRWCLTLNAVEIGSKSAGPMSLWGRYQDEYVKTEGGWKIRSTRFSPELPPPPA